MTRMLEGKVAIITGAGSGFGQASATLFAEHGASVVAVDLNGEAAEAVAKDIGDTGGQALAVTADVSDEAQIKAFVDAAVERFGRIDVLFNNAGIYVPGNAEETELAGFMKSLSRSILRACTWARSTRSRT